MRQQYTLLDDLLSRGFDASYRLERDDNGRFCKGVRVKCSQCAALVINGMACHETGCSHIPRDDDDFFDELNTIEDMEDSE
jgi:hypothetical protein